MKALLVLLLALLQSPTPRVVGAEGGLAELAASKRAAAIKLSITIAPESKGFTFGVFISEDGLALVALEGLGTGQKLTFSSADGTPLKLGAVLGIFPERSLALLKFKHRPKVWLRLAPKEPEVRESIAFVTLDETTLLDGKAPPVVGPVLAKRSKFASNLRIPLYKQILSLGSDIRAHTSSISNGCYAIDRRGDLVAFLESTDTVGRQLFLQLTPVVGLADEISSLVESGKTVPYPLPEADNPLDPAITDPDWRRMVEAMMRGDQATGLRLHGELQKRYPSSIQLKGVSPKVGKPAIFPEPDKDDPTPLHVSYLTTRASSLLFKDDYEGAIRDLKSAIAASPKDFPSVRYQLAMLYLRLDRLDDAEPLFREAYQSMPENIELVEQYAHLLFRKGRLNEGKALTKWAYDLRGIYGW